ncbi:MAG: hypothetical protein JOZ13_12795 [Alphaproteobacteria bacterium]|nr:hypothetical protein [Alphaproteobacteria bacterium]
MQAVRAIVIFLVGAGIAIGAHFAGLFERLPHWFAHPQSVAGSDPYGYDVPPPGAYAPADPYPPADGYAPAEGYPSDGYDSADEPDDYAPADESDGYVPADAAGGPAPGATKVVVDAPPGAVATVVPGEREAAVPVAVRPVPVPVDASGPVSLRLAYRPQLRGSCAPAYAITNRTHRTVFFSVAHGYGAGGGPERPLRIAPGATAAPVGADRVASGYDGAAEDGYAAYNEVTPGGCDSGVVRIVVGEP